MITIASFDPGKTNSAYSIIQMRSSKGELSARVLENGMCRATLTQLANSKVLREEGIAFKAFIEDINKRFSPDVYAAERYMSRRMGGTTIELVNMMLGWMMLANTHLPQRMISAATWKNAVRRRGIDLDATYKLTRVTPHQLDATLIGLFIASVGYKQKDFGTLDMDRLLGKGKLLRQIEQTSIEPLHNRKGLERIKKGRGR